jgi:hypothetical protein
MGNAIHSSPLIILICKEIPFFIKTVCDLIGCKEVHCYKSKCFTTFNNISVISWLSVLLVEETGVPGENHRPAASH